ncbi:hypothetical protein PO909_002450 [Leuciscus waleckii]
MDMDDIGGELELCRNAAGTPLRECVMKHHAQSALKGADCERFPLRTLRSRRSLFEEGGSVRAPRGSGPASVEAERRRQSWGSQMDLTEGFETGSALSQPSPVRSSASVLGVEARAAVSSPQAEAPVLQLSSSEELDVVSIGTGDTEDSSPQSPAWVLSTLVGPEQALVMEQEVETLLRKEAIERVPPPSRESGYYSQYFIVPKKDGGLRPILDLHLLNRTVGKLKFKILTLKQIVSQIRSEDWFVTIDLKDAYFHVSILPQHRKFLRFAFGGEAYQYRVLPFGLALSPRTFTKCMDAALVPLRLQGIRILNDIDDWLILAQSEQQAVRHRDVVLAVMEKCAFSITEYHFSRCGVGFEDDAGTFVSCSYHFDPLSGETRPVTHCQIVSENIRSHGSSVQRYTLWPVVHETVVVVAQNQGVLPEGKPTPHDQGHATMSSCPGYVGRTLVSLPRARTWSSLSSRHANDGCFPHGLGSDHEWSLSPRSVAGPSSLMAHKLSRNAGGVPGSETLPPTPQGSPCACPVRQHIGGLLHKPSGGSAFAPLVQAGSPDPSLDPRETSLIEGFVYTGVFKSGGRHPVEAGAEAQGMETPPRGGGAPLEGIRSCRGGPVRFRGDIALPTVVLPELSSPSGVGCHGAGVAEVTSVHISPDCSAPRSSGKGPSGWGQSSVGSPVLAGPSVVCGPSVSPRRLSSGDSDQEGPTL